MKEAHVRGVATPALREDTIGDALTAAAEAWPEREALVSVHQGVRWTYRALNEKAEALAAGLFALGLRRGDRLGIWAPNCAEWTLTQFATAKAGIILVNINPAYRLSELEYTLNKVGVKALVTPERFKTSEYAAMVEELAPEIARAGGTIASARLPHLKHAILIGGSRKGWHAFDEVAGLASDADRRAIAGTARELDCRDAINIQFTSGTTGLPKGATLSHHNILNNGFFVGRSVGLKEGDRLCIPVPLYHCFGMVMGNLGCLTHGATMVYPAEAFDPLAVLQAVEKERCTGLYGVPTMFIAELGHPDFAKFDLSSLRTGCMAGSPCPVEVMKQVISAMNMKDVTIAYGMTETSPVSFQTGESDPLERRVSTIGRVQPHLECKVVDLDGKTVACGEPGELCTRGYSVMIGYWDDDEKTAEAIDKEGWMHTGDLATIDAEGYGNIVGRLKDMVIRGGENVYPREIEEYLYRHPKVEDVAVVGVPDPKFGEEICAWVKLKPGESATEDEIKGFCKGQIAHYKVPRYVRFVTEFPMTVTGKVQKFQIRDAMIAELKLEIAKTA
ncbi:AMP-binding protein [Parvibaculum sp.]|uniref:AMP-binding protein n=1 Tax=Parvibaculum sp. TaxID=2024848 RepID=UPI00272F6815|nr:AMP-binding protein [Parvibaculum sp.]MDP1626607.1 AMP-binding protein [Parvibaculum sp.]MDP2150529.1 AMP-binding protein [Parvibaculum sp.]MDP3328882.1 AMP-binding protein [Parvibaculum sp.]